MPETRVEEVLAALDGPVQPRAEFADALLVSLLDELDIVREVAARPATARREREPRRWSLWARPAIAFGLAALLALGFLFSQVLLGAGREATAIVRAARDRFAALSPFTATVTRTVPGGTIAAELGPADAPDLVVTREVSYLDDTHWRVDVVANSHDELEEAAGIEPAAGSWSEADGTYVGRYDAEADTLVAAPASTVASGEERFEATGLMDPALHPYDLTDARVRDRCEPLEERTFAGRAADGIACENLDMEGIRSEVLFDRATGLVLLVETSALTGAEIRPGETPGRFVEVTSLETEVSLEDEDFDVRAPKGASILWEGETETPARFRLPAGTAETIRVPGARDPLLVDEEGVWFGGVEGGRGQFRTEGIGFIAHVDPVALEVTRRSPLEPFQQKQPKGYLGPLVAANAIARYEDVLWVAATHSEKARRTGSGENLVYHARHSLERFDIRTGDRIGKRIEMDGYSTNALVAGEGSMWAAVGGTRTEVIGPAHLDLGEVVRIDPVSGAIEERVQIDGSEAGSGGAYVDGTFWSLWALPRPADIEGPFDIALVGVDESGRQTKIVLAPEMYGSRVVTDGTSLWVAGFLGEEVRLFRVDPATGRIVGERSHSLDLSALAYGDDHLWAADRTSGRVVKIDPPTLREVDRMETPAQPSGVAVLDGQLWVTAEQDELLARIQLPQD